MYILFDIMCTKKAIKCKILQKHVLFYKGGAFLKKVCIIVVVSEKETLTIKKLIT